MVIRQGDLFWVDLDEPVGSGPGYRHPHVVVQNNVFNQSRLHTIVVCALTSNLQRANVPGNVLLDANEGDLPTQSVVVVSQLFTIDKSQLDEHIGMLSRQRVLQILDGINLLLEPREID
ncbi:type II toxin-antitoxin system PemK/MazF family toxin [Candidatus Sumerlaeota bacterium]|nr:type II toxin-antitoxin system PemK/MazF family toxin [Candidatus Sumerlaeota bacterium]